MRSFGTTLAVVMLIAAGAWAHGPADAADHAPHAFPMAEVLSGVAALLAAASFWMSIRTRRFVERSHSPAGD